MGIPGSLEAGKAHLGSHRNTWESIRVPGRLQAYLLVGGVASNTRAAIRIPEGL